LSRSDLEDTRTRALIEIMMAGSSGDICLFCLQPVEPVLGTRGSFGATLSQKVGAGAQVTCGGPGATPGWEAGAGAAGARGGPGAAPSREAGAEAAGTHGSPGAAPNREAGAVVFT
jgi:hypothetical protein